jgi:O-antigen ligase
MISAFLFGNAVVTRSYPDIAIFVFVALVPFFMTFPNVYFLGFLLFRSSFDAIEKYDLPLPNPNTPVAALLIFLYGIILLCNKKNLSVIMNSRFLKRFNLLFMLFLAAAAISFAFSEDVTLNGLSDLARLLSILLLVNYTVVYISRSPRKQQSILNIILFSSIIPVGLGLYQLVARKGMFIEGSNRVFGSFVHPNVFAEYLAVVAFLLFLLAAPDNISPKRRLFMKGYLFIVLILILNTFTRNVWLALFITANIYITFGKNLFVKIKTAFAWSIGLLILMPFILNRILDLINPVSGTESSWEWRVRLWKRMFVSIFESPFWGHGFGSFQDRTSVMAHNDYLRLSYEIGFVGLFFYLLLIGMIMISALKKATRIDHDMIERRKGLIVFCTVLTMLIISMADNLARSTVVLTYIFTLTAVFLINYDTTDSFGRRTGYAGIIDK